MCLHTLSIETVSFKKVSLSLSERLRISRKSLITCANSFFRKPDTLPMEFIKILKIEEWINGWAHFALRTRWPHLHIQNAMSTYFNILKQVESGHIYSMQVSLRNKMEGRVTVSIIYSLNSGSFRVSRIIFRKKTRFLLDGSSIHGCMCFVQT